MISPAAFRKILAIAFLLALPALFLIPAAYQAYPCPFAATLMGQSIKFPMSIGEFQKAHPTLKSHNRIEGKSIFRDSSQAGRQVEWLFRSTLIQSGHDRPLYGVNIFLYGYPQRLDSVMVALEKQFGTTLIPIGPTHHQTVYSAALNDCTRLFVGYCDPYEWRQTGCVRIAIANHLSDEEALFFATHSNDFEPEYD